MSHMSVCQFGGNKKEGILLGRVKSCLTQSIYTKKHLWMLRSFDGRGLQNTQSASSFKAAADTKTNLMPNQMAIQENSNMDWNAQEDMRSTYPYR